MRVRIGPRRSNSVDQCSTGPAAGWLMGAVFCLTASLVIPVPAAGTTEHRGPEAGATQETGFTNHWILNAELSDDPQEKMREAMQGGRGRGGGMGGRGGGGMGGRGGGGMGGGRRGARGAPGAGIGGDDSELQVQLEGNRFSVRTPDGRARTLNLGDDDADGLNPLGVTAGWDGAAIVIETSRDGGMSRKERYELVDDMRLVVVITINTPNGGAVEYKRVYDAAGVTAS